MPETTCMPNTWPARALHRCARAHILAALTAALLLVSGGASAAQAKRTVLVLSVAEEGRQHDSLRAEVGGLVERAGARLVDSSSLSASARRCDEPTCLAQIGNEFHVELILAARIERHSRHDRLIEMWIYDTSSGRDQSAREACDARALRDCMTGIAGKLVGPQLAGVPSEPPPPALRLSAPPPADTARPRGAQLRLPGWRLALGGTLAALAAGGLITGIVAHVKNDTRQEPCVAQPNCLYNTVPLMVPSYAVAGLAALGATLSFALPSRRRPSQEVSR